MNTLPCGDLALVPSQRQLRIGAHECATGLGHGRTRMAASATLNADTTFTPRTER